jgi:hypothetical protein
MNLRLPLLVASILTAAPAAFGHDDHRFGFPFPPFPRPPAFRVATPRFSFEFGHARPVHRHAYRQVVEREWVAPVWRDRLAGYDHCGRPRYERVLVRCGYWTTVRYDVCACGSRIRC